MLETIREFGLERLAASEDELPTRRRHAEWCLALAEAGEPDQIGPRPRAWLEQVEAEYDNLRAALAWADGQPDGGATSLRLAGALAWFWRMRGHLTEGRGWLRSTLDRAGAAPAALRARGLRQAGDLAWQQGDLPHARSLMEASLSLWQEAGD